MKIHISYGSEEKGEWVPVGEIELDGDGVIDLPNGEQLNIGGTFTESNMGVSVIASIQDTTLAQVFCYKKDMEGADPSIVATSPKGLHLSLMVAP